MNSAQPKVSIVVATYRSGAGLDRLVASLDAQSLPADEWEVIFVDDGSPDDTYERLGEIARSRPNYRVTRIENSGWPCRPRNTGIELARGEYVAFMDHDDELFPDALRDGYGYAHAHAADVLNGKEARTDDAGWAIDQFPEDMPQVLGAGLPYGALTPTNPHKLYRRELLIEHGIRFREGGRVLWEDIFFNVEVLARSTVVSTLASTPYYHWFTTAGSGSTTFRRARPEWWHWLNEVITAIDEGLASPGLEAERRLLREHQYRSRLMDAFNGYYVERKPEIRKLIFEHGRRIQADHFSEEDDACLDVTWRLRAELLRAGHPHALDRLIREDPVIGPVPRATSMRWSGGKLHLDLGVTWKGADGRPHPLRSDGQRIFKDLSEPFTRMFAADQLDVTDEIDSAAVAVGVRSDVTRIGWLVPSSSTMWTRTEEQFGFGVDASAVIDPSNAALGRKLDDNVWDLTARCVLGTQRRQPMLRGALPPAVRLSADGVWAAYAVGADRLVLDLSPSDIGALLRPTGTVESIGGRVSIQVDVDEIEAGAAPIALRIPVRDRRDVGIPSSAVRRVGLRKKTAPSRHVDALLVTRNGSAWVELDAGDEPIIRLGARFPGGARDYRVSARGLRTVPQWRSE